MKIVSETHITGSRVVDGTGNPWFYGDVDIPEIRDVWVNGVRVLQNGTHTGATSWRWLRGPGVRSPRS